MRYVSSLYFSSICLTTTPRIEQTLIKYRLTKNNLDGPASHYLGPPLLISNPGQAEVHIVVIVVVTGSVKIGYRFSQE